MVQGGNYSGKKVSVIRQTVVHSGLRSYTRTYILERSVCLKIENGGKFRLKMRENWIFDDRSRTQAKEKGSQSRIEEGKIDREKERMLTHGAG